MEEYMPTKHKIIIHLSDLHLGFQENAVNCADQVGKVKEWILSNCTPRSNYVIVITGDLIDSAVDPSKDLSDHAEKKSLWDLSKELIQEFSQALPTGEKYEVLLVPGNHDYGTGSKADKENVIKFKQHYFTSINFEYPHVRIVGDGIIHGKIAFIGLDSNEKELGKIDRFWAEGQIGGRQRDALKLALRRDDVKACDWRVVYLHHHPFESSFFKFGHWLKDKSKFKKILKDASREGIKIDALLFGHNHGGKSFHNKLPISRVYDGGTVGGKSGDSIIRIIEDLSDPDVTKDKLVQF